MHFFAHKSVFYKVPPSSLVNAIRACTSTPTCNIPNSMFTGEVFISQFKIELAEVFKEYCFFNERVHVDAVLEANLDEKDGGTLVDMTIRPGLFEFVFLSLLFLFVFGMTAFIALRERSAGPFLFNIFFLLFIFLPAYIPYRLESQKLQYEVEVTLEKAASVAGTASSIHTTGVR